MTGQRIASILLRMSNTKNDKKCQRCSERLGACVLTEGHEGPCQRAWDVTNSENFTLESYTTQDGCIAVWTLPVIKAAVKAAAVREGRRASERALPRFTVKVDGDSLTCERSDRLAKILSDIRSGAKCRVFRNAGFGATIDFDKEVA